MQLEFYCQENEAKMSLVSAKKIIPQWYKDEPSSLMLKHCMPFIDGFISGYSMVLKQDIDLNNDLDVVGLRDSSSIGNMPIPFNHDSRQFLWKNPYIIKTPKKYSILICHPINRYDLPFTTLSAIVDSDSIMPKGNLPFFIKEGFEGIIKAGTPIFQIIPFIREKWTMELNENLLEECDTRNNKYKENNFYKKYYWDKKQYE
jgi:hypothetical protein